MVSGAYDLQMLRMQAGLRLCANFRAKLGLIKPDPQSEAAEEEAEKIIDRIRTSYRTLTEGVARNRTLPEREGFTGDELISDYSELVLTNQFFQIERQERVQFQQLLLLLEGIPIYDTYLSQVYGIGPAMAGVLITYFNPHKARHISSFWKYAGLDVAGGSGRSRRKEHLVQREYTTAAGDTALRDSVTYNPFLKSKLMGVLTGGFMRKASPWRAVYDDYKNRLETDPARERCSTNDWKKRRKAGEDVSRLWTPGRINNAAKRYMVKMFLAEFWVRWRTLEGLPVTEPYAVAKLGHSYHASATSSAP